MNTYVMIDTEGEQLQLETGRFYDVRHLVPSVPSQKQNTKIVLSRVLVIRSESTRTLLGRPWLEGVTIRGRILHICRESKVTIYKMRPKKKYRRLRGHRQNMARFVVDGIFFDGNKL